MHITGQGVQSVRAPSQNNKENKRKADEAKIQKNLLKKTPDRKTKAKATRTDQAP